MVAVETRCAGACAGERHLLFLSREGGIKPAAAEAPPCPPPPDDPRSGPDRAKAGYAAAPTSGAPDATVMRRKRPTAWSTAGCRRGLRVPAVLDHDHPAASVRGRRHERVVRGEDRELSHRSSLRVVRGAEGDEPADAPPVAELDEVAGDETAEAVADNVHARGARVPADLLDPPGEPGDEALVVDAGRVGEAREVPDATASKEASQDEEVRPGTAEAMDEDDGGRMRRGWVEAVAHQQAERPRGGERAGAPTARPRPPATTPSVNLSRSRPVLGLRAEDGQEDGVEQEYPVPPVGVGQQVLVGPAEGDVGVLPVLEQLAGDEDASALGCGLHNALRRRSGRQRARGDRSGRL